MANDFGQAVRTFLDAWIPEFQRSVEMFTGQSVKIKSTGEAERASAAGSDAILWQGQTFERGGLGSVWIGTPVETCNGLTKSLAEEPSAAESVYRELLKQSFEGAAHVLSSGRSPRMVCKQAIEDGSGPSDLARTETARLWTPAWEGAPILVGIDAAFASLVAEEELQLAERPAGAPDTSEKSARLERLADIELPIAVVLGRTRMQIREVLKLTAGSLVELDRRTGDPVEIVVHNAVVARGEVVSVSGNYGVRIKEVISRGDRFALQANVAARASQPAVRQAVH
jgi:flagellar motor switch protein FliN